MDPNPHVIDESDEWLMYFLVYRLSRTVIVNKTTTHPYPHYKPISAGVGVIGDCILHEWNLYMLIVVNIYVAFQFIVVNCQMWLLNVSQCKKLSLFRYVMQSFFSSQKDESNRRCRSWKFHHLHVKIISFFRNRRVKLKAFYSKRQKCAKNVLICYYINIFKLNI